MTTEEEMARENLGARAIAQTKIDERKREGKMQRDREIAVRVAQISQEQTKKEPKTVSEYPALNQGISFGKPHGPNLNGGERDEPKTTEAV